MYIQRRDSLEVYPYPLTTECGAQGRDDADVADPLARSGRCGRRPRRLAGRYGASDTAGR